MAQLTLNIIEESEVQVIASSAFNFRVELVLQLGKNDLNDIFNISKEPESIDFIKENIIANNKITPKSERHKTPIEVDVNLPLALNSFITAIADAGDLATKIDAHNNDKYILISNWTLSKNSNEFNAKKTRIKLIINVTSILLIVFHLILLNFPFISVKKSSEPAANGLKPKDMSNTN